MSLLLLKRFSIRSYDHILDPKAELTSQRLELAAEKLLSCPKKIAIGKQKSSAAGAIPAIAELYML